MEGRESPSAVAVAAGGGSEQGNAETKRQMEAVIEDQQEEGNQAVAEEDGSGSESGNEEWQLSPPTLMPLQELVNACRAVLKDSSIPLTYDAISFIRGVMDMCRTPHLLL